MSEIPTTVKDKKLVQKRREQIILSAIKLFSEKGFFKTTMRELAEESGLSYGNIYDYVGSKEDIFFLIHDFLAGMAINNLEQSIEGVNDPLEKLRRMVRAEFEIMSKWPDALLLIYQESHILNKKYLKKLLEKERYHLEKFEVVIQECIEHGILKECNVRLIANLIKSMIDSWVLKRWDLRGYSTPIEAEKSILEMVFYGYLKEKSTSPQILHEVDPLKGKYALIVNANTVIGKAICAYLISKEVNVAVYGEEFKKGREFPYISEEDFNSIVFYNSKSVGALDTKFFQRIEKEFGLIDFFIFDLGVGNISKPSNLKNRTDLILQMDSNILNLVSISNELLKEEIIMRPLSRILYIAPWGWDRFVDEMRYENLKNLSESLTKFMAQKLSRNSINVNCIVPGFIKTLRPSMIQKDKEDVLKKQIPLGNLGDMSDFIQCVDFLLGEGSRYLTGQVLKVAGGLE